MNSNQNQHQFKKQNPLFSAAVTGGIDDLGIVLATAEKPVFTIGAAPVINDLDNFSEVSLDRDGNSEIGSGPIYSSPLAELDSFANLQNLHDDAPPTLNLDVNSNDQFDVNTNPISAAFGSAASSVFSTFTNIIKGSASQPVFEENLMPLPPPTLALNENVVNPYGFASDQTNVNAPPPAFFTPGDENLFKKTEIEQTAGNTFRLGSNKKKTYAHIPGLSSSQPQAVPQNFNLNPVMPPLPPQPVAHVDSMANFQSTQMSSFNPYQSQVPAPLQEVTPEKLPSSSKFSFSSLLEKIPVTKSLFGSSNDENNQQHESYGYQEFTVTTQNYYPPQQPQIQSQLNNEQQPSSINFFNQQSNSFSSAQQLPPTDVKQTMPPTSSNEIANPTVNFFNPQQFNTSPFAKAVHQPTESAPQPNVIGNQSQTFYPMSLPSSEASVHQSSLINSELTTFNLPATNFNIQNINSEVFPPPPPITEQQTQFTADQRPPSRDQTVTFFNNQPTIPIISSSENQPNYAFAPQSFSTPPSNIEAAPISFFNPTETSELFKSRQNDDGRPKNPYSNTRMRGVGLYKARSSLTSESTSAQVPLPPAPIPSSVSSQMSTQQFFTPTPYQAENQQQSAEELTSRPSSLPPATEQQQNTLNDFSIESTSKNNDLLHNPSYDDAPIENKSDFINNDLEHENVADQYHVQPAHELSDRESASESQNVSNFFSNEGNEHNLNEQVAALNFFQVQQEEDTHQVDFVPQPSAPPSEENQNVINFFSIGNCSHQKEQPFEIKSEDFNSSNLLTSSTMQTPLIMNDTASMLNNDITDKMESLSACSRSTLSLFATSELDSTTLKSSGLESLIPKYLETQQQQQQQQQPQQNYQKPVEDRVRVPSVSPGVNKIYRPVYCHWFYQNLYWSPFSMTDSLAIENAIASGEEVVNTSGGRFEVNIKDRRRTSIYWSSGSNAIRKCSWFYMENRNLIPYEEKISEYLEKEYEKAIVLSSWNRPIHMPELLPHQDFIIMKDAVTIEHHEMGQVLVVKRGLDEFDIVDGEEGSANHLILCISNFGDKIDDNVDEVRSKCMETLQQYYSEAFDNGQISRIEVLPIALNSIDVLKMFEINSIIENATKVKSAVPRDVNRHVMCTMLYSNENFYEKIMNHLSFTINETVSKFRQRNPNFNGGISLISASYEALFMFDLLLANQLGNISDFWKLNFEVSKFFSCGMPISLLTIRNGDKLRDGLKICKKFFNILHPLDPLGQRVEPLIIPEYAALPPENLENLSSSERIDFILPENTTLENFTTNIYFSSEILVRSLTNEIYGAYRMDSGSM